MKRLFLLFIFIGISFAQNIEEEFLETLNEVSEIATKEKLNIDKTPSTVTVIRRDRILKSGATNLLDILNMVAGIELSRSPSGKTQIIVRGDKQKYRDKIKLLINGTEITNNLHNNQFYFYSFPASLIKRVEITKTPDSILYGSNAYMGVINVITIDGEENYVNFYKTNKNLNQFAFSKKIGKYGFLSGYFTRSNPKIYSKDVAEIDLFFHNFTLFRESVKINAYEKNYGGAVGYKKDDLEVEYRLHRFIKGDFFGFSNVPPYKHDKFIEITRQYITIKKQKRLSKNLRAFFEGGIKNYIWNGRLRAFPVISNTIPLPIISNDPQKDLIAGARVNEIEYFFNNYYKIKKDIHNITFGLAAKYAKPLDSYYVQYIEALGQEETHLRGKQNAIKEGIDTQEAAIYVEDLADIRDNFSVITGVRVDKNRLTTHPSYKAGFVYNFDRKNTFKMMYNHAFRTPSWVELYSTAAIEFNGNENLNPEKIDMIEFNFLHRFDFDNILKLNLYYAKNKDTIQRDYDDNGKKVYMNKGNEKRKGIEICYKKLFLNGEFFLGYSYNDIDVKINGGLNGTRKTLLKGYIDYSLTPNFSTFTFIEAADTIKTPSYLDDIEGYFVINETFKYDYNDYNFYFGVKNILDSKIYYFTEPTDRIGGRYLFVPLEGKVPSLGRRFFITVSKRW